MAVIINEFEVVSDSPPPANPQAQPSPPPAQPSPRDIERIVRHIIERELRVRAH